MCVGEKNLQKLRRPQFERVQLATVHVSGMILGQASVCHI